MDKKPVQITPQLAEKIADGTVELVATATPSQLVPAEDVEEKTVIATGRAPRKMVVKTKPAPRKSKAKKSTGNLIQQLGLPRLEKRTKSAMLKRAEEIEKLIKKGDVPKSLLQRATERAEFYRQQGS